MQHNEDSKVIQAPSITCIIELCLASSSALLIEFDTADSAIRFYTYVKHECMTLQDLLGKNTDTVNKSFNVIA